MTHAIPSGLLRAALALDAAASGTLALVQLLAPHAAARALGLLVEWLVGTGVLLAAHTALLLWLAVKVAVARALVRLVVLVNVGWAMACAASIALLAEDLTASGIGYLLAQAAGVLAFASAQALGLQRSAAAERTSSQLAWNETIL